MSEVVLHCGASMQERRVGADEVETGRSTPARGGENANNSFGLVVLIALRARRWDVIKSAREAYATWAQIGEALGSLNKPPMTSAKAPGLSHHSPGLTKGGLSAL